MNYLKIYKRAMDRRARPISEEIAKKQFAGDLADAIADAEAMIENLTKAIEDMGVMKDKILNTDGFRWPMSFNLEETETLVGKTYEGFIGFNMLSDDKESKEKFIKQYARDAWIRYMETMIRLDKKSSKGGENG